MPSDSAENRVAKPTTVVTASRRALACRDEVVAIVRFKAPVIAEAIFAVNARFPDLIYSTTNCKSPTVSIPQTTTSHARLTSSSIAAMICWPSALSEPTLGPS